MDIKVKLADGTPLPHHARSGDAGMDLTSRESVRLFPGECRMVGTGVAVEIPDGYFGLLAPRSGLAGKKGVSFANTPGIIDSGYRGEIMVPLKNTNPTCIMTGEGTVEAFFENSVMIDEGERIVQLIIIPYETCNCIEVDDLGDSERGRDGFGSTGK